ncbi:a-pheromone receptor PreA [Aspergillus eucalypticola CBS 122712]|uniref:A-pheromone receptor PreA n=1 Tax=Aspergillus eucalypticola (strain CBS 122712 / IBT 29274) TaxID=1448314 RepID=A0A317VBD0_ASPEC|nr:a-pheromone receptor PreA [Aspergillus eucalypticola CBS 122712]PWY69230.1 a-pheromone receptor PreA [Aspergillus eucalypticola CBS 122712]
MASPEAPVSSQAILLPVTAFVSVLLSIIPLVLHCKNRNVAASSLILWYILLNIFNIINALIWPTDDIDSWWDGKGLCDIEVKVMIASYVAIPGTLVCIFRTLAQVLDTSRANLVPTQSQRWWNHAVVLSFCAIAPVVAMLTHYVYQSNRYILYAIAGCLNNYDRSWVTLVLAWIWPLVICLIAGYYCVIVLHRLTKYRSQFGDILQSANSNLTKSRFLRLFLIAFMMLWAIIPVQTYVVASNIIVTQPWHSYSWSVAHPPDWNEVIKVPVAGHVFYDRWIPVASGYMFFIFFGSGRDAFVMYRAILIFLGFGRCFTSLQSSSANGSSASGFLGSRAKLLFNRRWTTTARAYSNTSADASRSAHDYHDIEKDAVSPGKQSNWRSRYGLLWFLRGRPSASSRETTIPLRHIAEQTTTIRTNAWAGVSQSRGSSDHGAAPLSEDHIRVKQVIRQESELHV